MRAGSGDLMRRVEVSSQNALDKILKELIKLLHLKKEEEEVARISPEGLEHRNGDALLRVQRLHGVILIL